MGRTNKRIEENENFEFEMPKKKGTSYQRRQKDIEKHSKEKKRSKRLSIHSDSERARSREQIHNFLSGNHFNEDED